MAFTRSFSWFYHGTFVGLFAIASSVTYSQEGWFAQNAGTTNDLYGVAVVSPEVITIVGTGGVILRTTDSGATWDTQSSHTTQWLEAVGFSDFLNGTAVGVGGTILRTTDGSVIP